MKYKYKFEYKCPDCTRHGTESKIIMGMTTTTLANYSPTVINGEYHHHDWNDIKTSCTCTNGHNFLLHSIKKCPTCDLDFFFDNILSKEQEEKDKILFNHGIVLLENNHDSKKYSIDELSKLTEEFHKDFGLKYECLTDTKIFFGWLRRKELRDEEA